MLTTEEEIKEQMGEDGDEVDPTVDMLDVGRSPGALNMPMSVMQISQGNPSAMMRAALLD